MALTIKSAGVAKGSLGMINGAHIVLYSANAEADRAFLRDMLGLSHIYVGDSWLIFALPPAEIAVHPGSSGDGHELFLMCEDIEEETGKLTAVGIACGPILYRGWGRLSMLTLPSGAQLGLYEPRHARPS
jgi:hypothetical protein